MLDVVMLDTCGQTRIDMKYAPATKMNFFEFVGKHFSYASTEANFVPEYCFLGWTNRKTLIGNTFSLFTLAVSSGICGWFRYLRIDWFPEWNDCPSCF